MARLHSLFIPFALLLFVPNSISVFTGYFCGSTALQGGSGTFSVYDTATNTSIGCLDKNFRWVVDGSCAAFTSTPIAIGASGNYYTYSTSAGICSIYSDPSTAGYVYYCGPPGNSLTFECDMTRYEGHAVFSQRALAIPTGNEKVNVTFQQTSGAPGFAIELVGVAA